MQKIVIFMILVNLSYAKYYPNALFGYVKGISNNDTLSVREKPNYHSKKITELPLYTHIGLNECIKNGYSTWCRVDAVNSNLGEYKSFNGLLPGWVNAKYLKFSSRGYVAIKGKKQSCYYSIGCSGGRCNVVTDEIMKNGNIIALKIKSYPRNLLKGIGELDIPSEAECYPCGRISSKIDNYLLKQNSLNAKSIAKEFLKALKSKNLSKIESFIHPTKGIIVTNKLSFSEPNSKKFNKRNFAIFYKNGKKLYWGSAYARGNPINMSLKEILNLKYSINKIDKIKTLDNLKGFKRSNSYKLKDYEFYWKGKGKYANYNWLGADIILAKINNKWYIVGLLWNRWTI